MLLHSCAVYYAKHVEIGFMLNSMNCADANTGTRNEIHVYHETTVHELCAQLTTRHGLRCEVRTRAHDIQCYYSQTSLFHSHHIGPNYHGHTHPNTSLRQVCPHGDLFARRHIRIAIPAERVLQLLQLLRREMRALSTLTFVLFVVLRLFDVGRAVIVVAIVAGAASAGRCARRGAGAVVVQSVAAVAVGHLGFDGDLVEGTVRCGMANG